AAFAAWLAEHHAASTGIWLRIAKSASGIPSVTYAEALDEALCYGWIDGQKKGYDADAWLQKFTPRRPKSIWSKINRDKVAALITAGRMQPAGLAEVERAKADGRWDAAYDSQRTAEVPADLLAALDADEDARAFFATLNSANRYAVLWRIQTAKRPETRAKRVADLVAMLGRGEKLHP
ncbi:MAG: YdeI/OmpD-associated family protein, partial [Ardenticatenales bacterium]